MITCCSYLCWHRAMTQQFLLATDTVEAACKVLSVRPETTKHAQQEPCTSDRTISVVASTSESGPVSLHSTQAVYRSQQILSYSFDSASLQGCTINFCDQIWKKPSVWDQCAIRAMRVYSTSGQKLSKFRFCHIYVKQPFFCYHHLRRLGVTYQGEISLYLQAPRSTAAVQGACC